MIRNVVAGILGVCALGLLCGPVAEAQTHNGSPPINFLVMGGGYEPEHNEIALEKNVLYFQRTLRVLGQDPRNATIYFASGKDGQRSVRFLDDNGQEHFKPPEIQDIDGASTESNFKKWLTQSIAQKPHAPVFIYFTGHGGKNKSGTCTTTT